MEPYKLDASLDANKVFVVKRSELENRIDPNPYSKDRIEAIKSLAKNNHLLKLKDVIKSKKTVAKDISSDDIYIGLENIISDTGEYIETSEKDSISSANTFKKGQILFPKLRPYLNKVYYTEFDGLCSTEFHVFESKTKDFDTEFLSIYLRLSLIVNQTKHLMTGNTLPRLQTSDIENLPIPKIDREIQQQIVDIYNNAYAQKQAKEAEAKALLASIDMYLLKELGITLPEKYNSLEARIFTTNFSEVIGGRFDPKLYDKTTTELKKAIINVDKSKFITKRLKDILVESVAGDWGIEDEEQDVLGYTKCLVIRATEFDNDYNLSLENSRVKYRLIKDEKLAKLNIKEGDLLIEKSGGSPDQPVGRIALITKEELNDRSLAYSNFIHKITVDNSIVNSNYLFAFLKTIHNIKLTEAMQSQTNGIRNLIMSTYLGQKIVLPINDNGEIDLEKQNEIAEHIASIRANAKALQQEAEQVLAEAKQQVEQIILG